MPLLPNNPNETAYVGGRKHWTDVIKNSGAGGLLIWRQPEEDFNDKSTLIVMPGEVAVFVNEGKVEEVFRNGTYKLNTENYPFVSRLKRMFSGGISTFNCVVYFIRTADSRELLWGTSSPIQVRDFVWGILTNARAHGSYKVRITDPVPFLEKLVGNNILFQKQSDIDDFFKQEVTGLIRSTLSIYLNSLQRELIGLDAYIQELSAQLEPQVNNMFSPYGLQCVSFVLSGLTVDTTKYDAIDEAQIAKIAKLRAAEGDKGVMEILGENWEKQKAVDILTTLAGNTSSGSISATGAGIGMGVAAGSAFANMASQIFDHDSKEKKPAEQLKSQSPSQNDMDAQRQDPVIVLSQLKKLLDAGLIEQAEYDEKKKEVLSRM